MPPKPTPPAPKTPAPAASKTPAPARPKTPAPARPSTPGAARPSSPAAGPSAAAGVKRPASQSPPAAGGSTSQASRPTRSAARDRLNNLVINAKEGGKVVEIKDGVNSRYDLIEEMIRKALRVLESSEGMDSLVKMTIALLQNYTKRKTPTTWGARTQAPDVVRGALVAFVGKLRANFPEIQVRPDKETDGATYRDPLFGEAKAVDFAQFDLGRIVLALPSDLIADIMKAQQMGLSLTNHMFHMILTVCHEIIHILVCALSAETRPETPPDMAVEGHTPGLGESGWYWETTYLGGIVKMHQDKTDPAAAVLKTRQPGIPLLATGNSSTSTFRQIDQAYINNFIADAPPAGFKRFPIRYTAAPPMSYKEVFSKYGGPMATARAKNKAIKNPSGNNSPERPGSKVPKVEAAPAAASGSRASSRIAEKKAPAGTLPVRPKP